MRISDWSSDVCSSDLRQHHAQAGHVGEDRLVGLRMVLRRADAAAPRHAQHHRAGQATAGAVAHARGVADDEVDHRVHEAVELRLDRKSTRLLQSLMRISYAAFCLKKKEHNTLHRTRARAQAGTDDNM